MDALTKPIRELCEYLGRHGVRVHSASKGRKHIRLVLCDGGGPSVFTSASPSDQRARRNVLRDAKRIIAQYRDSKTLNP